jgi:hypothetical protein
MESYVVRIYRRTRSRPPALVGVVELGEGGGPLAFHDAASLWNVLAEAPRRKRAATPSASGPPRSEGAGDDSRHEVNQGGTP